MTFFIYLNYALTQKDDTNSVEMAVTGKYQQLILLKHPLIVVGISSSSELFKESQRKHLWCGATHFKYITMLKLY